MSWLKLYRSVRDHPKFKRLARDLNISHVQAVGHITLLWAWVLDLSPDGSLVQFDPDEIEEDGAEWTGEPGAFIQACINRDLIDDLDGKPVCIHDWMDYAEGLKMAQRAKKAREAKAERKNKKKTQQNQRNPPKSGLSKKQTYTPASRRGREGERERERESLTSLSRSPVEVVKDLPPGAASPELGSAPGSRPPHEIPITKTEAAALEAIAPALARLKPPNLTLDDD